MNPFLVLVIGVVLVATVCASGSSVVKLTKLRLGPSLENVLISGAFGFGLGAYLLLGFGQLGWIGFWTPWAVLAILGLFGLYSCNGFRIHQLAECRQWLADRVNLVRSSGKSGWLLVGLIGLMGVSSVLNLISNLAPPTEWDSLTYHLAEPKFFAQQGKISFVYYRDWAAPLTAEMWNFAALLIGSDRLAQVIQWTTGLIAAGSLYLLASSRTSRKVGLLAAVVFYTSPHMLSVATSAKSDSLWFAFIFLSLHALLRWDERRDTRWLWVSAVFTGLALATKFQGLFWAPSIGSVLLLMQWRGWLNKPVRSLGQTVGYVIVAGLFVAPWWIRSWVAGGDPVWPYGYPIFHSDFWTQELHDKYAAWTQGPGRGINHYIAGLWNVTLNQSAWLFGLRLPITPVILSFIPFIALNWGRIPSGLRLLLGAIFIIAIVYYSFWHETYQLTRYLFPVLALLMITASYVVVRLIRSTSVRWVSGICVAASLLMFLGYNVAFNAQFIPVVAGVESEEEFLVKKVSYYHDIEWMNDNLPADARVLFFPLKTYYLDLDFIRGDRNLWPIGETTGALEYMEILRARGITHIFYTPGEIDDSEYFAVKNLIEQLKSDGLLKSVYSNMEAIKIESRILAESSKVGVEVLTLIDSPSDGSSG